MIAIGTASPIGALIQIGQLPLVGKLFGAALIPPAVAEELDDGSEIVGDWRAAPGAAALTAHSAENEVLVRELSGQLYRGDAAAIAVGAETADAVLLIDEAEGRRAARRIGVRVMGTVGVLVVAKRFGHLPKLAPILAELQRKAHQCIGGDIVRRALELAGEHHDSGP